MTVPTFAAPPHTPPVFRVLKTARRAYSTSGGAAGADIPTIAGQAAANPLTVSGTVYVAPGIHMPTTVTAALVQGGTSKGATTANVNLSTGAFSVIIPGASATAGAGVTAQVTGTVHTVFTTNSNSFTLS